MIDNQQHRFFLDKSSKKFYCPQCDKKRLVKYFDNDIQKYLSDDCGRCDREASCGYHLTPKMYFSNNPNDRPESSSLMHNPMTDYVELPIDYIDNNLVEKSLKKYEDNNFMVWLRSLFQYENIMKVAEMYKIGTSKKWNGSTVFWQIDDSDKVRQAKVILYDKKKGNRDRSRGCFFAGKQILKLQGNETPNLKQCFFGQHLIDVCPDAPIGIVESEKTAILMTLFSWLGIAPKFLYIATGGTSGCKWYETSVNSFLIDRDVIIFPDLGAFEDWTEKSFHIQANNVIVSNVLEKISTESEKEKGFDIADYYLRNFKQTQKPETIPIEVKTLNDMNINKMENKNPIVRTLINELKLEVI